MRSGSRADAWFAAAVTAAAGAALLTLVGLGLLLLVYSFPAVIRYGGGFFVTSEWDPVAEQFGALHLIYGTVMTSAVALLLAGPIGIGAALFIAEYAPAWLSDPVSFVVELLAVIPSIVYGLWGFFVLAPIMRGNVEPALKSVLEPVPVLSGLVTGPALGKDLLTAGTILAIMILPTIVAIAREVFRAVPDTQREGCLALGATKWETIRNAVLPYARGGLVGAAGLGLARALGETMAVTMVVGNSSSRITGSVLTPGYTMASAIANQFTEAAKEIYFNAIVEVALVLLLVATAINMLSRLLVWRMADARG